MNCRADSLHRSRGYGTQDCIAQLPETAIELRRVARSVQADQANLFLGADATETHVKSAKLDRYRIVYFAKQGLLGGDVAEFAKLKPNLPWHLRRRHLSSASASMTAIRMDFTVPIFRYAGVWTNP
jgi:hypothetical protein